MDAVSKDAQLSIAAFSMFPGFRFSPTDEELISYYLKNKLEGPAPGKTVEVISEVDICNFEPCDLPATATALNWIYSMFLSWKIRKRCPFHFSYIPAKSIIQSDNEWFFFSPRGRKYPNGAQSRRATEFGYWKATGKERNVKSGSNVVGTKRTLVFHVGRAPKGERTEWIMHEYCMNDKSQDSMVVCRLRKNSEFRLNDTTNRGSSSRSPLSTMHKGESAVSEIGNDQGDKAVECSSKKSTSSHDSQSIEQIDSASDAYQKLVTDATQADSTGHQKGSYDEDFYADILNDDIININLDESLVPAAHMMPVVANNSEAEHQSQQHMQDTSSQAVPFQGTSNRRIYLRKRKQKFRAESQPKALVNRMDDRHALIYILFVFLVLLAVFVSNFCFPDVAGSVSAVLGKILASKKHHM